VNLDWAWIQRNLAMIGNLLVDHIILSVLPVLIAIPILWATYGRFPLTTLLYVLIFVHALVLILGGAYTYARVPLGFQIADALGLQRNPYDRIGHFFQGFVPALIAREILIRGDLFWQQRMSPNLAPHGEVCGIETSAETCLNIHKARRSVELFRPVRWQKS